MVSHMPEKHHENVCAFWQLKQQLAERQLRGSDFRFQPKMKVLISSALTCVTIALYVITACSCI